MIVSFFFLLNIFNPSLEEWALLWWSILSSFPPFHSSPDPPPILPSSIFLHHFPIFHFSSFSFSIFLSFSFFALLFFCSGGATKKKSIINRGFCIWGLQTEHRRLDSLGRDSFFFSFLVLFSLSLSGFSPSFVFFCRFVDLSILEVSTLGRVLVVVMGIEGRGRGNGEWDRMESLCNFWCPFVLLRSFTFVFASASSWCLFFVSSLFFTSSVVQVD